MFHAHARAQVNAQVLQDSAAGRSEALKLLARSAARGQAAVDRKLVKQTVMTSVYGVTSVGG
jgi:DNA-directed RNA polymerase